MIEERAVILSLDSQGSPAPNLATLEIERKTACGLCGQTRGCGNSLWGKLFRHHSTPFRALNEIGAKVGDSVVVGIDETALMRSALLLYFIPLVSMIFGAILVSLANHANLAVVSGAIAGLVIGFLWVKAHTTGSNYFKQHQPKILRLYADEVGGEAKVIRFQ